MQITIGKFLSLLVVMGYVALAIMAGGFNAGVLRTCLVLLLPLALIWFPEEIGSVTGYFKSGYVNVETPALVISVIGWFFLVGLPAMIYFLKRS